jgi:hypothetical protein
MMANCCEVLKNSKKKENIWNRKQYEFENRNTTRILPWKKIGECKMEIPNLWTETTAWNNNNTKIQALMTSIEICNLLVIKVVFDEKN